MARMPGTVGCIGGHLMRFPQAGPAERLWMSGNSLARLHSGRVQARSAGLSRTLA